MHIDQELENAILQYRSFLLAEAYLKKLKAKIARKKKALEVLTKALKKRDHEMLEFEDSRFRKNFRAEDKAAFENVKEAYHQLVLQYKESKKSIELAEFEAEVLVEKVKTGPELKENLYNLLQEGKDLPISSTLNNIDSILELTRRLDDRVGLKRLIKKAIQTGQRLLEELAKAEKSLNQIKENMGSLGVFDSLIGISVLTLEKIQELVLSCEKMLQDYKDAISAIFTRIKIKEVPIFKEGHERAEQHLITLTTDLLLNLSWKTASDYLLTVSNKIKNTQSDLKKDLFKVKEQIQRMEEERDVLIIGNAT